MRKKQKKNPKLAERIADLLFFNGVGEEADRLVLMTLEGRNLGGWCRQAVIDQVVAALNEE